MRESEESERRPKKDCLCSHLLHQQRHALQQQRHHSLVQVGANGQAGHIYLGGRRCCCRARLSTLQRKERHEGEQREVGRGWGVRHVLKRSSEALGSHLLWGHLHLSSTVHWQRCAGVGLLCCVCCLCF
jgi:hypothetical protein